MYANEQTKPRAAHRLPHQKGHHHAAQNHLEPAVEHVIIRLLCRHLAGRACGFGRSREPVRRATRLDVRAAMCRRGDGRVCGATADDDAGGRRAHRRLGITLDLAAWVQLTQSIQLRPWSHHRAPPTRAVRPIYWPRQARRSCSRAGGYCLAALRRLLHQCRARAHRPRAWKAPRSPCGSPPPLRAVIVPC